MKEGTRRQKAPPLRSGSLLGRTPLRGRGGPLRLAHTSAPAVVVLDDSPDHREIETIVLEQAGFEVTATGDAAEARTLLTRIRPSLLVIDAGLPGIDGFEVARRVRLDPDNDGTAILMYSAYGPQGEQRAHDAGCDGYLSKPARLPDLAAAAHACARTSARERRERRRALRAFG